MDSGRFRIDMDGQVDRFEQYCILGVVVLYVPRCLLRDVNDGLYDAIDRFEDCRLVGWGIVLQ